jgi:hypothetical protein
MKLARWLRDLFDELIAYRDAETEIRLRAIRQLMKAMKEGK